MSAAVSLTHPLHSPLLCAPSFLSSHPLAAPLLFAPTFKGELPPCPSPFYPPPTTWKGVALQGFPNILRELLALHFLLARCEPSLPLSLFLYCSCSRLIPTDRPVSTSEAPHPLRMENEVLVKINLFSPLLPLLRRHAEKNHLHLHCLTAANISNAY